MPNTLPGSVVFITGTFIGNNCWEDWKLYFESKGYQCTAPAWPHKDDSTEELRNTHPDTPIASNRLPELIDFFAAIVSTLPEKPILIGHAIGGLIVQLLIHRGLGTAGIAVHSFPPPGMNRYTFPFLKAWWPTMGFFTSTQKSYLIPFRKWKLAIANGMDCKKQKELYYKYALPESKLITRDALQCMEKINFNNPHPPLLFLSGSGDKMIPASLNYKNYNKYKSGTSITGYKNFQGRNHLFFDHPEWIEEADFMLHWLQRSNSI
jgi:pimeloyl-ACP methyl ester carboxylesterase